MFKENDMVLHDGRHNELGRVVKIKDSGYIEVMWSDGLIRTHDPEFLRPSSVYNSLAYKLFCTEPDVIEFAKLRGEGNLTRVFEIAWERDENGWKTAALTRASKMEAV